MFNKIIALVLIILLSPLFVLIMLFVFLSDGFPLIFTQKRVGENYRFFKLYKFRTMKNETPNVATHLLDNPSQFIIKGGSIIRKLSLDELPNLINILLGEMVFVGPRPALYNQDDLMRLRVDSGIYKLKPGLTGWAQINGRDTISNEEKVRLEIEYLEKRNFIFDIKILFSTVFIIFIKNNEVSH